MTGTATTPASAISRKAMVAIVNDKRHGIEPDKAPFFLLLIDDVQSIKQRLDPGIGAPQRDQEPDDKTNA